MIEDSIEEFEIQIFQLSFTLPKLILLEDEK